MILPQWEAWGNLDKVLLVEGVLQRMRQHAKYYSVINKIHQFYLSCEF
jgi:hypothetical protein